MPDLEKGILVRDPTGKFKILRGGRLYDLPIEKVSVAPPPKLTDKILEKSGIVVTGDLKERLEEIIEAYSRDVRDRFETKSTLIRPVGQGGMGFSAEQADLIMKLIKDGSAEKEAPKREQRVAAPAYRQTLARKEPLPPAGVIPEITPEAASPAPIPKMSEMAPGVAEFVFSPADEAEILAVRQKLPKAVAGLKPVLIAKIIREIIVESKVSLPEEARKKLENILLINLRDIRDGFETRETLVGLTGPAGIPMTPEQVEKILSVAGQKLQKIEEKTKETEVQKIKQAMEGERTKSETAKEKTVEGVRKTLEDRWREITKKQSAPPMVLPKELVASSVGLQVKAVGVMPRAGVAPPQIAAAKSAPPAASASSKVVSFPTAAKIFDLSDEEKPKPLEIFKPIAPPQVRRPIPPQDKRPRLDDVKYVPKLVGPVEELREMTLIDWRRLGSTPAMAASKVKEKISLLERQSFGQKIAGIKAWQESEVNKLYLEISRESLAKGVSADQIITERVSAGKTTLTGDDYRAVMELNRSLRY
jgi:hypothetical protein